MVASCQWTVGDGVSAGWHDRILSITGSGKVYDFASADLKTWKPAKTVNLDVPVEGGKGFYLLKSK